MLARIALGVSTFVLLGVPGAAVEAPPPRLVLFLVIDQARADYFTRFRPVLEGGLASILGRAIVFSDAHQRHAITATAPGHASLSTGLYPRNSGIVSNDWFDRRENREVYCLEDADSPMIPPGSGDGRSPRRLLGTALGDWMKARWREARVFSIGDKDRSAALMGGKKPDAAFWYDHRSGQWVTSRYYLSDYPGWVQEFHASRPVESYLGARWGSTSLPASLLESMEIEPSAPAVERAADDGSPPFEALFDSPYIEVYLLDFARLLVVRENVGKDEVPDLLALSFASVDSIGHDYGPNSPEVLDAFLRLDRELAGFLRFLDEAVGLDRVAIAISADHGVAPLPEYRASRGLPGGRLDSSYFDCLERARRSFEKAFGEADWFADPFYFDRDTLSSRGVAPARAEEFLAKELSSCPSVASVWTRTAIEDGGDRDGGGEPELELYRHGFHPDRSPDIYVQREKWFLDRRRGTTHGSPYEYDTHVPAIILWPGVAPRTVTTPIATVDLPVTLASLLGIETPRALDGVDRSGLMR
jgi:predicted AlkP superfamily pyrophosphatase or phosphodiesterase